MSKPSLTSEQISILSNYEHHFQTASSNYLRGIYHDDIQTLSPIYESLGKTLRNQNCASCVLEMFKILGREYYKSTKK